MADMIDLMFHIRLHHESRSQVWKENAGSGVEIEASSCIKLAGRPVAAHGTIFVILQSYSSRCKMTFVLRLVGESILRFSSENH